MKNRFRLLLALALGLCAPAGAAPFSFALIGDLPYGAREERLLAGVLEDIDRSDARFTVHVGDIKAGDERCDDDLLAQRKALLARSKKPLVYLPGDNEWADCGRTSNGSYDAVERLSKLRDLFYPDEFSLGEERLKLFRQSETVRYRAYRENARWEVEGILFVTFNVAGSNNHYVAGAGRNGEFEERILANKVWLRRALDLAKHKRLRGIVILSHANPLFGGNTAFRRDGYREWKGILADAAKSYPGEILFVHGDTHWYRSDQPLADADKKPVANFTRVEVFGSPFATSWVKVTADTKAKPVFRIEPVRTQAPNQGARDIRTRPAG
jgi:hypothetical protein